MNAVLWGRQRVKPLWKESGGRQEEEKPRRSRAGPTQVSEVAREKRQGTTITGYPRHIGQHIRARDRERRRAAWSGRARPEGPQLLYNKGSSTCGPGGHRF
ncbi:hypothetical protein NDU88_003865 [Pleurodeles waltl]|uniref:Uncharacterized protein n=1 Tax=Pleurodeles waltl TaxID=8319 RepID=A0AAV7PFT8_PLEWA|nr:hypothetical protein NDU88_003865 [Pleurodeles waltl]